MVSGTCEWCHRRRLMSWVAFHRKHTETPWGRRIRNDEFWKIENPTCRNIPKQPEEKSLFNRSSRYVKTASRFHITGKSEGLRWCQLHSNLWHPLLHLNLKPKKHTWQNAYLAWKEPNDDDRWGERSPRTRDSFEAIYRNMIDSSKLNRFTHKLIHAHTHTLIHLYTHTLTHTHTLLQIFTHIHPHLRTHWHTHTHLHTCAHLYTYTFTPSYTHLHTYTHSQTLLHTCHTHIFLHTLTLTLTHTLTHTFTHLYTHFYTHLTYTWHPPAHSCTHLHTYAHICTHLNTDTFAHTSTHLQTHTHTHTYTHTYLPTHEGCFAEILVAVANFQMRTLKFGFFFGADEDCGGRSLDFFVQILVANIQMRTQGAEKVAVANLKWELEAEENSNLMWTKRGKVCLILIFNTNTNCENMAREHKFHVWLGFFRFLVQILVAVARTQMELWRLKRTREPCETTCFWYTWYPW